MNSPLLEKSMDFATSIVVFYEEYSKSKKDTMLGISSHQRCVYVSTKNPKTPAAFKQAKKRLS